MIPKRDGLAAIRLFMTGMSSRNYPHVLSVGILIRRRKLIFTSQALWRTLPMLLRSKNRKLLSSRISLSTIKVLFILISEL